MASAESDAPEAELVRIRRQIDELDDAILDLIAHRDEYAAAVAKAKAALGEPGNGLPFRPAREVAILRRMLGKAGEMGLEPDLVGEIWRALIGANARKQANTETLVVGGADPVRQFDLARRHFGTGARLVRADEPRAALTKVLDQPLTLAVMPYPGSTGPGAWWVILNESRYRGLMVLSALPFWASEPGEPEAVLVARAAPLEPAGGDHTFAVAFDPHHRGQRALLDAGLSGREIARARDTILLRFDEFVAQGDSRLERATRLGLDGLRIVGSYARV